MPDALVFEVVIDDEPIGFEVDDDSNTVAISAEEAISIFAVTPGDQGVPGPRGSIWFVGNGPPEEIEDSQSGDFYLDSDTGTIYELSE